LRKTESNWRLAVPEAFDPDDGIAFCQDKPARCKIPKRAVARDELPRNPAGKVLKRVLIDELG
jgi:acyl-CoA synthetase (AMP-forming)/AMP-acid ligase II